jgi:hypothetical protein
MKMRFIIFQLIFLITVIRLHGQSTIESKKTVVDLIRGQYSGEADIDMDEMVPSRLVANARYILDIGLDDNSKANNCWISKQYFRQEYNPYMVTNGINLSNNYNWDNVDGTYSKGTYKINPTDSSVTFTWQNDDYGYLKGKLKSQEGGGLVLELNRYSWYDEEGVWKNDNNISDFTKEFDFEDGEYIRSKSRLDQLAFEEKKEKEEKIEKYTKITKERDEAFAQALLGFTNKKTELKARFGLLDSLNKRESSDYLNDLDRIKEQKAILDQQISGYEQLKKAKIELQKKYNDVFDSRYDDIEYKSKTDLEIPEYEKGISDLNQAISLLLKSYESTKRSARKFEEERVIKSIVENPRVTEDYYLSSEFYLSNEDFEKISALIGDGWQFVTYSDIKKIGVEVLKGFNGETLVLDKENIRYDQDNGWKDLELNWKKVKNVKKVEGGQGVYFFKGERKELGQGNKLYYLISKNSRDVFNLGLGKIVDGAVYYNQGNQTDISTFFGFFIKSKK